MITMDAVDLTSEEISWQKRIVDAHTGKIIRICYEVNVLKKLADRIRCREIWIEGSFKHPNPDEDLPNNFEENKEKYFDDLSLPLGKVLKTIFMCNYLMYESIRQEIQEGLNVVELWNGVSKFIFYGRAGEISSNHEKAQTLSVMSLHLLQLSMVYINTLMIQQIIEELGLKDQLTKEDKRALTALIYEHVNPYGLFLLDLSTRLPHLDYKVAA